MEDEAGIRVLVVDDNVRLAATVVAYLKAENFEPEVAHSAEDAMAALAENDFALALMDINMPGVDGFELCRRVLDEKPEMKVVMLSGRQADGDGERAAEAGAELLLYKPMGLAELCRQIRDVVAGD